MRRLLALIVLLALVLGPPAALLAWGFTDWGAIHLWSPTDVRVLLAVLTVVGWAAWAVWLVALVVEAAAALSGRRVTLALPGLAWPRALAATLVGAILATGASAAHAAGPAPAVAPAAARVAESGMPVALGAVEASPAAAAAETVAHPQHTVVPGDDLWTLAERYYGDGTRWRTLVDANPHLQGDPIHRLLPGTVLTIPDPVAHVVVRAGDTLSGIAADRLGDPERWPEVHALNAERIADPDLIHPGWVLDLPTPDTSAPALAPAPVDAAEPTQPEADPAPEPTPVPSADAGSDSGTATQVGDDLPTSDRLAPDTEAGPAVGLLGGVTALSAAAVLGGVGLRRRLQEHHRPLGRRYAQPDGALARYEEALGRVADLEAALDRTVLIARAMRHLARRWWQDGQPPPALVRALAGPHDLVFEFDGPAPAAPDGFTRVGSSLATAWVTLASLPDVDHAVAYPGLVTLGEASAGHLVLVDVMASGVLGVREEGGGTAAEVLSGLLVELACAPWAEEVDLLVVTRDQRFAQAAGEGRIACEGDVEVGVASVERLVRQRARFTGGSRWDEARLDLDLAEAWSPQVVLFEEQPDADQLARLEAALAEASCGVAAIAPIPPGSTASADWALVTGADGRRSLSDAVTTVLPQTVPETTREAVTALYDLANDPTSDPAPWWEPPREEDVNIIALRPAPLPPAPTGPRLNLLGPVELVECAGAEPPRAVRQCIEYCAWLHLHPGATPVQMGTALLVSEGTRRSNMSRLRSWLGAGPDGVLHLPDAYSGRIFLSDAVSSDWAEFRLLLAGGVNRAPLDRLVTALELVRGAPLADAAPGQWGWAEEFRSDAAAMIRDAGVVAARTARGRGDLDTARWAANRALLAAPDDELLLGERIRTEFAAGRTDEVNRLVDRVVRTARRLGVDLLPETVELCQEVVEGRVRARA